MPDPITLLAGLTEVANRANLVAISWHIVLAALGVGLWLGLRPSQRAIALGSTALPASAAACALVFANPFNAMVLGTGAATLAWLAARAPDERPALAHGWSRWLGGLLLAFGVWYPHFVQGSALAYLYAAPLGTLPCPSLSAAIGVRLLHGARNLRGFDRLLAGLGVFYGAFGALRLGVWIDVILLAGALGLLLRSWPARRGRGTAVQAAHA